MGLQVHFEIVSLKVQFFEKNACNPSVYRVYSTLL